MLVAVDELVGDHACYFRGTARGAVYVGEGQGDFFVGVVELGACCVGYAWDVAQDERD